MATLTLNFSLAAGYFQAVFAGDRGDGRKQGDPAVLGLDFVHVVPGSSEMERDVAATVLHGLATEVIPRFRGTVARA